MYMKIPVFKQTADPLALTGSKDNKTFFLMLSRNVLCLSSCDSNAKGKYNSKNMVNWISLESGSTTQKSLIHLYFKIITMIKLQAKSLELVFLQKEAL